MFEDILGQARLGAAAVHRAHDCGERLAADPVAAPLVADDVTPAARAGRFMPRVPAVHDRSGAGDDHDARRVAGAGDQSDERVVDDHGSRLVADAPHDRADRARFVLAVDTGDAQADGGRRDIAIADRRFHHVMQNLLDLELARGVKIRAAAAAFREDVAVLVGEQTHRLRSARIDAENMHAASILC